IRARLDAKVGGSGIEGEKRHEIVVRTAEDLRVDDEKIRQLPLRAGDHGLIKLGQVVDFKTVKVVEPILRDDGHRRAALMVNLGGRDAEGIVRDAEQRIKQQVEMTDGYLIEFGGQYKNLQEARAPRYCCPGGAGVDFHS